MATSKQPLVISLLAGIPVVTLGAWLWAGVGYTKDIERHTNEISEIKQVIEKQADINQEQQVMIAQLKTMFEMTQQDIREIKQALLSRSRGSKEVVSEGGRT